MADADIVLVVSQRGLLAFALDGTPYRFQVSRRNSRSWRWRAWHVWNDRTIGEGVERLRNDAILLAAKCAADAIGATVPTIQAQATPAEGGGA